MKKTCLTLLLLLSFLLGTAKEKPVFKLNNGINISHWLSQSQARGKERASYFTREDAAFIASLGFDHLRIPIDEEQMFSPDGKKDKEAFALLHNALGWCSSLGLRAVVDLHILRSHHFNDKEKPLFTDPAAQEKFYNCWRELSRELKKYPNHMVAYELMNEPVADNPETWNRIVNRCAETIRHTEPKRILVIGSNRWQGFETVKDLRFPENDPNIIISFHYYNPFLLTHYRAGWTDIRDYDGPVHYPGKLIADADMSGLAEDIGKKYAWWNTQVYNETKIESDFRQVLAVAEKKGLTVYCGEYGCLNTTPAADRNRWLRDMNRLFERHGIARAVWDYKGGFGIISNGKIQWPMIEAITGKRGSASEKPFSLHPDNPRYFLFRGKPAILVTSGEHYGALINKAFDFETYFETLRINGLNSSRVFMGAYLEPQGAFQIENNTLAPSSENYIAPWLRSAEPGYAQGGNKFDLTQWNPAYFERLHTLLQKASELDIILELNLFCPMYDNSQWNISPMNAKNNINGIGKVERNLVYTMDGEPSLLEVQESLVRKIVETVNGYDNFYFEICNEPYFGGVTMDWQRHMTDIVTETEKALSKQHLISVNVANETAKVNDPHPAWSIFNFHYCTPPVAVADNKHLGHPIGMNETGFKGIFDSYYRREAWAFMLSGGSLYNHLDYSFTAGHENGSMIVKEPAAGGGSPALRFQIGKMKRFLESFDFIRLSPTADIGKIFTNRSEGVHAYMLCEPGKQYALYLDKQQDTVLLDIPAGEYEIRITDPVRQFEKMETRVHPGGSCSIVLPKEIKADAAIGIKRTKGEK